MRKLYSWELWDWKTIRIFIYLFLVISLVYFALSKVLDHYEEQKNDLLCRITDGFLVSIEPIEGLSQGRLGNRFFIEYYIINYYFIVNGITYNGSTKIKDNFKSTAFIARLKRNDNLNFQIRYNPFEPDQNEIILNSDPSSIIPDSSVVKISVPIFKR